MQSIDIPDLIRPRPTADPARFVLDVPDGFQQGRGAWGGLATGAMTAAALLVDPRPGLVVRALSAQLVAPVLVGQVSLAVEELRRGSATNTVAVRVRDESGDLLAHGVVVLGKARRGPGMPDGAEWLGVTPPDALAAGPDGVPVIPVGPPMAPDFTAHLEFRPVRGLPYSGVQDDLTEGWIRPRGPQGRADAALVAALADAWWVSVIVAMDRPRPAATLGFTLDLPGDPTALPRTADGGLEPLFHRGRSVAARDGFTVEVRELWTRDGQLVSWNTQTVAIIK